MLATRPRLTLHAETAADIMVSNPVSVREDASLEEARALFTNKGISAAPVIDVAGWPVGVLSRSDVIVHDHTKAEWGAANSTSAEPPRVRDMMTPAVFSVAVDTPVEKIVHEMLGLHVHRLFVVDDDGVLVGVITPLDVLRRLQVE